MKKQILIVAFFILASFAGIVTAFGQGAVHWSVPRAFTCTDDALHPIAGKVYTYEAVGLPAGGNWHFWATKDPNFITDNAGTPVFNTGTALTVGAGQLLSASADYNINTNADGTIQLSWTSTILNGTDYQGLPGPGTPTFVVAYYVNASGCTDNIKVWELDPRNGFIVDIIAMDPAVLTTKDAYDPATPPATCVDNVESAVYNTTTHIMNYNYGDNYLYFEFVAANFTDFWVPTFALAGIAGSQAITSYEYTYATPDTWGAGTTWTALATGTTQISPAASVTDITLGVSIFVRVLIDHNQFEHLANVTYTMTLDGQNADGTWDVRNEDCTLPSPNAADQADTAGSTITLRPTVQEGTTSPIPANIGLIPGNQN